MIEESKQILLWGIKIIVERYFKDDFPVSIPDKLDALCESLLGKHGFAKNRFKDENEFYALHSIFSNLGFCEQPGLITNKYLHPNPDFELSPIIYPNDDKNLNPQSWKKEEALQTLKNSNEATDAEQLLNLLYKYGSRLPIFDEGPCALPIYDTVKILAALSTSDKGEYRLVIGDLSGIQDFIYTINPEGSLKVLRARSFYLELLTKSLAYDICEDNKVTSANILFSGGGNFLIVLPEDNELSAKLEKYYKNVNSFFLKEFEGNLHLPIASVPFSLEEIKNIRDKWTELYQTLDQAKKQKFYNLLHKPYNEARPVQQDECLICHTDAEKVKLKESEPGTEKKICDFCDRLKKFGSILKDLSYIHGIKSSKKMPGLYIPSVGSDYNWYYTIDEITSSDRIFQVNQINHDATIALFYSDYVTEKEVSGKKKAQDFRDLAKHSIGSDLIATMAMDVDNMGLIFSDGIHTVAKHPQHFLILTHVLSQNLDYFFKFALKEDILSHPNFRACDAIMPDDLKKDNRKVSVVYSGGDDLLLVGAWSDVLECAFDVHDSFERYTCQNSDIGLSGGIYVSQPSFPFYIAVKKAQAGERLAKGNFIPTEHSPGIYQNRDYSKSKIYDKGKNKLKLKDSITLFYDDTMHFLVETMSEENKKARYLLTARWSEMTRQIWDNTDESVVKHLKMFITPDLAQFIEENEKRVKFEFPRSFLSKLYFMVDRYRNEKDGVLYLIDLVYNYSRLNRELRRKLTDIYELYNRPDIKNQNYIHYLPIILNWLELLLRKKGEK